MGAGGLQRGERAARDRVRVALLGIVEEGDRGLRRLDQAAAVHEPLALLEQLRELAVLHVERFELADLELHELGARVAVAHAALEIERAVQQREPHALQPRDLAGEPFEAARGVEQLALRGRAHERLEFVLAVDVDQQYADLAQQLQRHGLAVQVRAAAAVAADEATDRQLVGRVDRLLAQQPHQRTTRIAEVETAAHLGALGAVAHDFAAGATAGEQLQRIDDDRLAGAGLAGEHGQAGPELDLGGIDDRQIADLQVGQHRFTACGPGRRGPSAASSAAAGSNRSPAGAAAGSSGSTVRRRAGRRPRGRRAPARRR